VGTFQRNSSFKSTQALAFCPRSQNDTYDLRQQTSAANREPTVSDQTSNLALPYILPSQAQKHVPHNEALQRLDAVVQLTIIAETQTPPPTPEEGACYLLATDADGVWAGKAGLLAMWQDGAWLYITPKPGWRAFFLETGQIRAFNGGEWQAMSLAADGSVPMLGINATPDTVNRLSVASPATLLSHAGQGHQLKLNKAEASDTGTLLFQTGWSGRAEMGLAGDDRFSIKVSADGSNWLTAMNISADGVVHTPAQPAARASLSPGTATLASASRTGFAELAIQQGGFSLGAVVPAGVGNRLVVPASGLYLLSLNVSTLTSSSHDTAIEANGATVLATASGVASAVPSRQSASTIVFLNEGDWLSLLHSGSAQYQFGPAQTELCAVML
jgi:hypothetical protein